MLKIHRATNPEIIDLIEHVFQPSTTCDFFIPPDMGFYLKFNLMNTDMEGLLLKNRAIETVPSSNFETQDLVIR